MSKERLAFCLYNGPCPCKGCMDRHAGCHAGCTAYIDWKSDFDARKENYLKKKSAEKDADGSMFAHVQKTERRFNR